MAYDKDDPMYQLLLDDKIGEFNDARAAGKTVDLQNAHLRGADLKNLNADGLDLQNAYFRSADLRGVDFRKANLEGASIIEAQVSGCYFPKGLSAEEIRLSLEKGIRLRYSS